MRRLLACCLVLVVSFGAGARTAAAQQSDNTDGESFVPADSTSVPAPGASPAPDGSPAPSTTVAAGPTTTALPAGCAPPQVPHGVFTGTLQAKDGRTARFRVDALKSGSLSGFAVGDLVDVVYEHDVKFLTTGTRYLVAVGVDDTTGGLVSKVRPVLARFGGDQVVGVNDLSVTCPTFADPALTKLANGTSVDTGVLSPMLSRPRSLLLAIGKPTAAVVGLLIVLVVIKRSVLWVGRTLAKWVRRRRAVRALGGRRRVPATTAP